MRFLGSHQHSLVLTGTHLQCIMLNIQERFKQIVQQKGKLPTRLLIQMDNCGRENKNQYVLKVFDEVRAYMEPV